MGAEGCRHIVDAIDARGARAGAGHRAVALRRRAAGRGRRGAARRRAGVRGDGPGVRAGAADLGGARPGRRRRRVRPGADRPRDHVDRRPGVRHRSGRRPLGHRRERRHGVARRPGHARPAQRRRAHRHRLRRRGAASGARTAADAARRSRATFDLDAGRAGRRPAARCCPSNPKRAYDVHPLVDGAARRRHVPRAARRSGRRTSSPASAGWPAAPSA